MNDLEERARRMLDAARPGHNPTAADTARVRAALKARVLAEPLLLEPSIPPGVAPAGASGVLGKLIVALGVGGSLGFAAGVYAATALWPGLLARPSETAVADAAPPATGAVAAPAAPGTDREAATPSRLGDAEPDAVERAPSPSHPATQNTDDRAASSPPLPARSTAQRAASGARPVSTAPAVSPLKAELDGLRRAQELLYQGRPAWAIARLDELDRAGVGSVLEEERAATRAIAECRLGGDGERQASEYARRFPRSAHLERVRSSCMAATQPGPASAGDEEPTRRVAPPQTENRGSPHEE